MEESFAGGSGLSPEEQAAADEAAKAKIAADEEAAKAAAESGNASGVAGSDRPAEGDAEQAEAPADGKDEGSDERNPAPEQSPVATEAQDAIVGDPGLRDEQQPQQEAGSASNVNTPTRTSAPPPEAQSGVPLPEDRAAGVEPGE